MFVDTPGLHRSEKVLNAVMNEQVAEAAGDCDVALLLVDLRQGLGDDHTELLAALRERGAAAIVVGTKLDLPGASKADWPPPEVDMALRISAVKGEGLESLVQAVVERLPESPAYYPEDELSDRPLRFLVAELVREAAFEALSQELPYSLAVEVESFDESRGDLIEIHANLIVERDSQKGMVIGKGGQMIKSIGTRARQQIEALVGKRVHLALRAKVEPKWTKKPGRIRALGYD